MDEFHYSEYSKTRNTAMAYKNKSLLLKSGKSTRTLTESETSELMAIGVIHKGFITIKFKTEKEGLIKANKFKRLARNPSIQLNVKFEKIV